MTHKIARIKTDMFDGSMSYEIYGRDIADSDAVEDDFESYLEQETGCEGDQIICFSTITRGSNIMEYVAWLQIDNSTVIATFNARFAIKTMMSFMSWRWRYEYKKIATPQPKATTEEEYVSATTDGHKKYKIATTIGTTTDTTYEKPFYIDDERSVLVVWKFLLEGVGFKTDFEGEHFTLGHYGDYEGDTISIVLTTVRNYYFVKNSKELYTLFLKLEMLNVAWGFDK